MVGTRIAPDNNDICVWKLDEATAPFVNSSTSPNSVGSTGNLTVISGTVLTQQPSPFAAFGTNSSVQFTGNNSGSPRNTINGANNFLPQPPFTVSGWMQIRNYDTTGFTQHGLFKQTTTGVWSGSTFASIDWCQNERYNGGGFSNTAKFDLSITYNSAGNGVNAVTNTDNTITLGLWHHVGLTYDGTNVDGYLNGNWVSTSAGPGFNQVYYSGTPGPWSMGAIPSGSGSPEESNMSFCDIRIANIIRPQSYFQQIYQSAALNINSGLSAVTRYIKMRAYDLGCTKPTPVYWIDTTVSYANAPAAPCGGPLGPIEIMEVYPVLNG